MVVSSPYNQPYAALKMIERRLPLVRVRVRVGLGLGRLMLGLGCVLIDKFGKVMA